MSFVTRATIQGGPAAGSFSSAMLLAAVRIQGNTMFRRGQYTKRLSVDEEHGQISKASSKPASGLSGLRLILGQFNRTPTHSARRADGRCNACQAPWTCAIWAPFRNFHGEPSFTLAHCRSHSNYPSICRKSSPSEVPVCPALQPSESKSRTQRLLMLSDPSLLFAVAGAPRTPSYDFTCKAFIDGCSHSPSRLAVSRVADSAPKSLQARLLCYFSS